MKAGTAFKYAVPAFSHYTFSLTPKTSYSAQRRRMPRATRSIAFLYAYDFLRVSPFVYVA